MIDADAELLNAPMPSWQEDAPLRRELERLREDIRAYRVAAGYDARRAAKLGAMVNERGDRIRAFLKGHRHGTDARRFWDRWRTPA